MVMIPGQPAWTPTTRILIRELWLVDLQSLLGTSKPTTPSVSPLSRPFLPSISSNKGPVFPLSVSGSKYFHERWGVQDIRIGENGLAVSNETQLPIAEIVNDIDRIEWYRQALTNIKWGLDYGLVSSRIFEGNFIKMKSDIWRAILLAFLPSADHRMDPLELHFKSRMVFGLCQWLWYDPHSSRFESNQNSKEEYGLHEGGHDQRKSNRSFQLLIFPFRSLLMDNFVPSSRPLMLNASCSCFVSRISFYDTPLFSLLIFRLQNYLNLISSFPALTGSRMGYLVCCGDVS